MGTWSIIAPDGSEMMLRDVSVHVQAANAAGVAPQHHNIVQTANGGANIYQRSTTQQRTITLHITPRVRGVMLPEVRLTLLAALNPDRATATSPAYIRYSGAYKTLQVAVVYTSGLEEAGAGDSLTLTLTAYDPIWTTPTLTPTPATTLATHTILNNSNVGAIFQRSALGTWACLGSLNNGVYALLRSTDDGMLYAGGAFTGAAAYVARWNENDTTAAWETVGSGLATGNGSYVHTLCTSPDGMLYAGGSIDGGVQRFDGTAWLSLALTDSSATTVCALVFGNDGKLYAGGE